MKKEMLEEYTEHYKPSFVDLTDILPKQETLEEAAERYANMQTIGKYLVKAVFKEGVKWNQERSYSEEEVLPLLEIIQKCKEYFLLKTDKYSDERADAIIDVMENFKKK